MGSAGEVDPKVVERGRLRLAAALAGTVGAGSRLRLFDREVGLVAQIVFELAANEGGIDLEIIFEQRNGPSVLDAQDGEEQVLGADVGLAKLLGHAHGVGEGVLDGLAQNLARRTG